jgi:folate-binding protein YgfZ
MPAPTPARWSSRHTLLRLEGPDSRRFLHGQSSQAIELAQPGACLATCLISATARMRALALVCLDATGADLLVLAGDGAAVHQALDRVLFPADQVRLGAPQTITLVRWIGQLEPAATDAAGNGTTLLQPEVDLGAGRGQAALLLRDGAVLPDWLAALPELSEEQVERLRLRQGFPAAPGELNDGTNPFELGLADWVSLNKGCYVGQETLAKLATYDGVKQQLRHWHADASGTAAADPCAVGALLTTAAGERAGVITSVLSDGEGLEGLALVRRQALMEPELLAGERRLKITTPVGFTAAPVGAGGRQPS